MSRRLLTEQETGTGLGISRSGGFLVLLALVSAVLRLCWLAAPLDADESGYLQVAEHWHRGGGALYGPYFVDRPPLLLELFRVAGLLGGIPGVRVMGAVAAAAAVVCVGLTARRLAGHAAALWAGAAAAVLFASPMLGTTITDGELLAAPFVAGGLLAGVHLFGAEDAAARLRAGLAAGACGMAAVLVKQNMGDVAVFMVAGAVVMMLRRRWRLGDLLASALSTVAGAVALCVPVLGYAVWQGSSLSGVFYAMYPFRVDATIVMSHYPNTDRTAKLTQDAVLALTSGAPVAIALLAVALAFGALRPATLLVRASAGALLVVAVYDVVSIIAGGGYWTHYLIELIVPSSLAVGLLAASSWRRLLRPLGVVMVVAALISWGSSLTAHTSGDGQAIGEAVKSVARPGDTIVSLYGDADIVQGSGLESPYRYLWSLPAHTLDPHGTELDRLLSGPDAPTWVVLRGSQTQAFLDQIGAGAILQHRYHVASQVCGRTIYVRDDQHRSAPAPPAGASASYGGCPMPLVPWFASS